jgi:hypothetical protein
MSLTVEATRGKKAQLPKQTQVRLTVEEEIFSLQELAPQALARLPEIFAESVVDSATKILGESTGEALIRCIGDSKLRDPDRVYARLDDFLHDGSDEIRKAIAKMFASKVHLLYKLSLDLARQDGHNLKRSSH